MPATKVRTKIDLNGSCRVRDTGGSLRICYSRQRHSTGCDAASWHEKDSREHRAGSVAQARMPQPTAWPARAESHKLPASPSCVLLAARSGRFSGAPVCTHCTVENRFWDGGLTSPPLHLAMLASSGSLWCSWPRQCPRCPSMFFARVLAHAGSTYNCLNISTWLHRDII